MSETRNAETDRWAVLELLDASTRHLDRQEFDPWLDVFIKNATYLIVCNDGVTALGTVILDTDHAGLAARLRLLEEPFRVRERISQSHLVTWGPVRFTDAGEAQIESRFALFETRNIDGVSKLSYVGRYEDTVVKEDGSRWRIARRRVVLDTFNFRSLVIPL
jgi:3-phenylpropionate/cinnamic acid dioxygenase small subunit